MESDRGKQSMSTNLWLPQARTNTNANTGMHAYIYTSYSEKDSIHFQSMVRVARCILRQVYVIFVIKKEEKKNPSTHALPH